MRPAGKVQLVRLHSRLLSSHFTIGSRPPIRSLHHSGPSDEPLETRFNARRELLPEEHQ